MKDIEKIQIQLNNKLNRIERMGLSNIDKNYKKILDDLRISIAKLYEKYEVNGQLTYDEMVKYNRLQKIDKEVYDKVLELYGENSKVIRGTLQGITRETYTNTIAAVNKSADKRIKGIVKDLPVADIVNEDMKGLKWTERMGKHRSDVIYDIQKEIKAGLREGDTYSTMTKRLKKRLETDNDVNIKTIVRTESHKVKAAAKEESFNRIEKAGVKFKEKWLTADDVRVRGNDPNDKSNHVKMHGVTIERGEKFILPSGVECTGPGDPSLPASEIINCRCIKILELE